MYVCVCVCVCVFCSFSYHYIIQINSKPIPALKIVIRQLKTQQTSVIYLASVLANHCLLHYDIKTKKEQFWLHLSCQDGSSHLAPLLCDRSGNLGHLVAQLGNPVKAERLRRVLRALRRRGLPSPWTSKCVP